MRTWSTTNHIAQAPTAQDTPRGDMGVGERWGSYKCHGIAQEDEPGRVVGEVLADVVEALVDRLFLVLPDLLGCLIDQV